MTEPPPMVPSAEERLLSIEGGPDIIAELLLAHREGFAAGVQAGIAELREPSDEALDAMRAAASSWLGLPAGVAGEREKYRRRCRALADHLEHQTATPAHPGGTTVGRID